jgi:hypothetical protein
VLTDEVGRQQVGFTRRTGKGKDMVSLCMLTHRDSSWMYTYLYPPFVDPAFIIIFLLLIFEDLEEEGKVTLARSPLRDSL